MCLRLALLIPAANVAGIALAALLARIYQEYVLLPWFSMDVFSWLWPWAPLLACVALLILGKARWMHFYWFALTIVLIAFYLWPF